MVQIRYVIQNVANGLFLTTGDRGKFIFNNDLLLAWDFHSEEEALKFLEENAEKIRMDAEYSYRLRIDKWIKIS